MTANGKGAKALGANLEVRLRGYRKTDAERVKELTVESFDGVSIDQNFDELTDWKRQPDWRVRKWVGSKEVLEAFPESAFVAEAEGKVVGYVACTVSKETMVGRIVDLAVDWEYRRQGVGSLLIARALENFRAQGMAIAKIETLDQNSAGRALYPQFGFREVAKQIHFMMALGPEGEERPE